MVLSPLLLLVVLGGKGRAAWGGWCGWLTPRPRAGSLLWGGGCQHYLRLLEFLLYWELNWPGNWGVTSSALFLREVSGCSRDRRCRPPPTLGLGCVLGSDSWDLMPREESSESEDTISWRGSLLTGFFFFFLGFSCCSSRKSPVSISLSGHIKKVEFFVFTSSLQRERESSVTLVLLATLSTEMSKPALWCFSALCPLAFFLWNGVAEVPWALIVWAGLYSTQFISTDLWCLGASCGMENLMSFESCPDQVSEWSNNSWTRSPLTCLRIELCPPQDDKLGHIIVQFFPGILSWSLYSRGTLLHP